MISETQQRVRDLVLRHGWNATCYQIVNPIFEYSFFPDCDAVVAFVRARGKRVVAGAPVCPADRLEEVLHRFHGEEKAPALYFGAGDRVNEVLGEGEHAGVVSLGAQPVWDPQTWTRRVTRRKSLRYQFSRARNKGVEIREWSTLQAENSSALHGVLEDWLRRRGLPPLHFLVEPETLGFLSDRRTFVAEWRGVPVAFLNLCPVPQRNGWLTEQFPRKREAPNGTVELLMHVAAQTVASEGANYLTMGLVPFSAFGGTESNPLWLRRIMAASRKMGDRFYSFKGLDEFKSKFLPEEWEPVYAATASGGFGLSDLLAILEAFTGEPLHQSAAKIVLRLIKG